MRPISRNVKRGDILKGACVILGNRIRARKRRRKLSKGETTLEKQTLSRRLKVTVVRVFI